MKINRLLSVLTAVTVFTACDEKNDIVPVSKVQLDKTVMELTVGETGQLNAIVTPEDAEYDSAIWVSSDETIATVSDEGVVSALTKGKTTVTVTISGETASCEVNVVGKKVESVTVTPSTLSIIRGEKSTIEAVVTPSDAEYEAIIWSSSDETIATVSDKGEITAIAPGSCTIIAQAGEQGNTCEVEVLGIAVKSITITPDKGSLKINETLELTASVSPEDADDKTIEWSSSDEYVATVSAEGLVTAVAAGKATITAKASNGATDTADISVIDNPKDGDFYYSDGTWSTELDPEKEAIGIVFWVGDPGAQDKTLKNDHPECVNGLVVSANGEYVTTWQQNYLEYNGEVNSWIIKNTDCFSILSGNGYEAGTLNDIVGYNNSKALEAFNAAPENASWPVDAVSVLTEFRNECPAPQNTSDWYLPSPKELSLLYSGEIDKNLGDYYYNNSIQHGKDIRDKLQQIPNSKPLPTDESFVMYWSSSEFFKKTSVAFSTFMGCISWYWDKAWQYETNGRVRYVLAF